MNKNSDNNDNNSSNNNSNKNKFHAQVIDFGTILLNETHVHAIQ